MPLSLLVDTSARVAGTRSRNDKVAALRAAVEAAAVSEIEVVVSFLSGRIRQGRVGIGYAAIQRTRVAPADAPSVTAVELDHTFAAIAEMSGAGSAQRRLDTLWDLLQRCTADEQRFVRGLIGGALRQGALDGVMVTALAKAGGARVADVRRAFMFAGRLEPVALALLRDGTEALAEFELTLFRPVLPMLAKTAKTVDVALQQLGPCAFEVKLDGARIQVHKQGDQVRIYSRRLREVTNSLPEVVEAVQSLSADELVLDGEVLALEPDGTPRPFQETMRRFGRVQNVAELRQTLPLTPVFFDCLRADGRVLVDEPGDVRRAALEACVPSKWCIERQQTDDVAQARQFFDTTMVAGHEGLMAKELAATYRAGSRSNGWRKIKPAHTLDLVVLAVEWGSGRRKGWLSNLHLGARDPEGVVGPDGGFVMLGKTFKGMTDETLQWQTEALQQVETHRTDWVVHVAPVHVVEIAFNDVQISQQYPGGVALRFARLVGYRPDKSPEEADTIESVRSLLPASQRF